MKKRFWIPFLVFLCLTCLLIVAAQTVTQESPVKIVTSSTQESPVKIVTSSSQGIFPESWLSADICAEAEVLHESEVERSKKILIKAMKKYPKRVLTNNLKTIYVLHTLKYSGISAGGTNSRIDVYIANRGIREGFTDSWIETTFHSEFSSILLRNFPQHLDNDAWRKANMESFKYGGSGVQAVKQNKSQQVFDASLHTEGFLYEYAKSTFEDDFNSIAEQLFLGNDCFWSVVDKFQRIKEKTDLVIAFYHKIDPGFSRSFFVSLAKANNGEQSIPADE